MGVGQNWDGMNIHLPAGLGFTKYSEDVSTEIWAVPITPCRCCNWKTPTFRGTRFQFWLRLWLTIARVSRINFDLHWKVLRFATLVIFLKEPPLFYWLMWWSLTPCPCNWLKNMIPNACPVPTLQWIRWPMPLNCVPEWDALDLVWNNVDSR